MAFDPRDPYDAAALYDMWLNCSHCPRAFDFEPGGDIDLQYYHRIGQQARRDGWSVLPTRECVDELVFTVLCPDCSVRLGVSECEGRLEMAAPAIDAICRAMEAAAEQAA
ncbi:MAG: hypothetical protein R3292_03125 [Alcanivorax sp.]|nr:hypothetical protein [Alcanivorax sp.]